MGNDVVIGVYATEALGLGPCLSRSKVYDVMRMLYFLRALSVLYVLYPPR